METTNHACQFLTRHDLSNIVPSALANEHDGRRSNRYTFVPTTDIVDSMEANGWGVVRARGPKSRTELSRGFGLHQLEFQSRDAVAIADPRMNGIGAKPIFPRIHIINSHNGTSRFEVLAGLYALVCSNGLMVSTSSVGEFSVRHNNGFNADEAHRIIGEFRDRMVGLGKAIDLWGKVELDRDQQRTFAAQAARIRWNKPDDIMPDADTLLFRHRPEDNGSNLWTVFNVVQENVIGGGFKRSRRVARPVSQIRESNRINSELWALAENTLLALD
jgi:hypothetical protein